MRISDWSSDVCSSDLREYRIFGIGDRLALRRLADQAFAVLGEGDDRRRRARALDIFDNLGLAALHDRDTAIRGAEVDPDHFGHNVNVLVALVAPSIGTPDTGFPQRGFWVRHRRSEEHTYELQSL